MSRRPVPLALAALAALVAPVALAVPAAADVPRDGGTYTLVSGQGLCLEAAAGGPGAPLREAACTGAVAQQFRWRNSLGRFQLINPGTGLCVGIPGTSREDGVPLGQDRCLPGAGNQVWYTTAVAGGAYLVRNPWSGKCITGAGGAVVQLTCGSAAWTFRSATAPPAAGGLVGWGAQNGGTTGGGAASPVTATSAAALAAAVSGSAPKVVRVSGLLAVSGMVRVGSNTTIEGVGAGSGIRGGGLTVRQARNVVIRNLLFRDAADDSINVEESTNVWVDHNDLANGYDGLIDVKRGSDFVTVSWNHLHDHSKSMLLGHSDGNGAQDRGRLRVTYHHNWFDGTDQRHPRVRFGNPVHVVNNLYTNIGSYGVASTEGAGVLVENNVFENVEDPFHRGEGDSGPGGLAARGNLLVRSGAGQTGGSVAPIPYSYSAEPASAVRASVTAGAGTGRL